MKSQRLLFVVTGLFVCSLLSSAVLAEEAQKKAEDEQEKFVTKVNFGKRVERAEALAIGKEFLQFQKVAEQYYTTEFGVGAGFLVKEINGVWNVVFLKKKQRNDRGDNQQSIRIKIDAKSGEVISHQIQQGFYLEQRLR